MKTLTKEEHRVVLNEITKMVRTILSADDAAMCWTGTKTDLLELLYEVYVYGTIIRRDGTPASFAYLVQETFRRLRLRPLRNPRSRLQQAHKKKGVRSISIIERLYNVLFLPDMMSVEEFWREMGF